jgi:hypothetical protein
MRYVGIALHRQFTDSLRPRRIFTGHCRCGLREVAKENYQWRKLWTDHEADGEDAASPSSSWAASATGYGFASPNGP